MLQALRDRITGVVAWGIVILISIPFALWGINQYFTGGGTVAVAEVNGVVITKTDLENAYRDELRRIERMMGDSFDDEGIDHAELKRGVLDQMINEAVLRQAAAAAGLSVSDALLQERIKGISAFQENGSFSQERYKQLLANQAMTPAQFESRMRQSLVLDQLRSGIAGSTLLGDRLVDEVLRLREQTRKVAYLTFPWKQFTDQVEVTSSEITDYYEDHPDQFMTPERVKLDYLELSVDTLAERVEVTDDELKAYYESERGRYGTAEQRRARHILIEVPREAGNQAVEEARAEAQTLKDKLAEGADFAELAREHSDDAGTAEEGGDLGLVEPGSMAPAFEKALFGLEEGEVSEPVRTQFGFHLIKLTDIKASQTPAFEEVRDEIAADYRRAQAERQLHELYDTLANRAYENPDTLVPASDALGLEIQHTDWIPRSGTEEGLGSHEKVLNRAFSEDVLEKEYNSDPIELGEGANQRVVVIRVAEHRPATRKPLEAVRDELRERLVRERAQAKAAEAGGAAAQTLRGGESPEAVAEATNASYQSAGYVKRNNRELPGAVVDTAFKLARPEGKARLDEARLANGDYAVVMVEDVREGEPSSVGDDRRKTLTRSLTRIYGQLEFSALLDHLRAQADITINENNL